MTGIKDQAFGMELEFNGITRREAAQAIAQVLNGNPYYDYVGGTYKKCVITAADGRKWIVEYDSSIRTSEGGEQCEFVTPKCTYEDIPTVQECIRALRRAGAKANTSCGIHVHVDGANHNAVSLKNLVYMMRAKQNLIFKAVGTQESRLGRWCKPIEDSLVENIKGIKDLDLGKLSDAWYSTYGDLGRSNHYNFSRYHALNLHSLWYRGSVEFRLFESTLHAGKVRAYITLCLAMSAAAINAKRVKPDVLEFDNGKNAMKCWLWRIGITGDEYKAVQQHLLSNIPETHFGISA